MDKNSPSDEGDLVVTAEERLVLEEIERLLPEHIRQAPEPQRAEFLMHVLRERRRKAELQELHAKYLAIVREHYKPLHPHLRSLEGWELDARVVQAVHTHNLDALNGLLSPFNAEGLWKAPFLSTRTCRELVEEVQHAEKWSQARGLAVHRPNSMNNYGVILDDFGLSEALQTLTVQYANAFSELLFPHVEASLDSHHGFVVEYEIGKDVKLDFHVDDSEVTLNICLGTQFEGGALRFGGIRCPVHQQTGTLAHEELVVQHEPGTVLLHLGRHRHQALDLVSGHRINLILWCRSSSVRSADRYMVCEPYCGLHPTNLKKIHDKYCACGNFEQHGQGVAFEEVSDSDEDEDSGAEESKQ